MKKSLIIALALAIVLALPTFALDIDVNVSVSKYGQFVTDKDGDKMMEKAVSLTGQDSYTIADALKATHEQYYKDGIDGFDAYMEGLNKLWGDESGNFNYQINQGSVMVMGMTHVISDGDNIEVAVNQSFYPDNEPYVYFDNNSTAFVGQNKEITLKEMGFDANWNTVFNPCVGANITINGKVTDIVTDQNGKAILNIDKIGKYEISAVKTKMVKGNEVTAISAPCLVLDIKDKKHDTNATAKYILNTVKEPTLSVIGGEWAVIGLARSGMDIQNEYYEKYANRILEILNEKNGNLSDTKYTEYSRLIVALSSLGIDATNVGGHNLIMKLGDFDKTVYQGTNGAAWALIALDSGNYSDPINTTAKTLGNRKAYVDHLLKCQTKDGGWNLSGDTEDQAQADITAMVLTALSNYRDWENVEQAVEKAIGRIKNMQEHEFSDYGLDNSNTVAQILVALCNLGLDPEGQEFTVNGKSLLDIFMDFANKDGSFDYKVGDSSSNLMCSEQALGVLVSIDRLYGSQSAIYNMSDADLEIQIDDNYDLYKDTRHESINKMPIIYSLTFPDLEQNPNKKAIYDLASRGIIKGTDAGTFAPMDTMTRCQFATIVVRALGLKEETVNIFDDVVETEWFAPYVGTAYNLGIVKGIGQNQFNPYGTISKNEGAVMIANAAKLCGMTTDLSDIEIRDVLAQFGDYRDVPEWAKSQMAFCYQNEILNLDDMEINGNYLLLRGEIAQMIYNLLTAAKLI